ncbi:MAG: hypothetical protein ACR2G4_00790 [Pyrinomonadaceae bacterium]
MTREKRAATTVASRRQRLTDEDVELNERQKAAERQRTIDEDLESRMRSALVDVYRALAGEGDGNESEYADIELVNELIH